MGLTLQLPGGANLIVHPRNVPPSAEDALPGNPVVVGSDSNRPTTPVDLDRRAVDRSAGIVGIDPPPPRRLDPRPDLHRGAVPGRQPDAASRGLEREAPAWLERDGILERSLLRTKDHTGRHKKVS